MRSLPLGSRPNWCRFAGVGALNGYGVVHRASASGVRDDLAVVVEGQWSVISVHRGWQARGRVGVAEHGGPVNTSKLRRTEIDRCGAGEISRAGRRAVGMVLQSGGCGVGATKTIRQTERICTDQGLNFLHRVGSRPWTVDVGDVAAHRIGNAVNGCRVVHRGLACSWTAAVRLRGVDLDHVVDSSRLTSLQCYARLVRRLLYSPGIGPGQRGSYCFGNTQGIKSDRHRR